VIDSPSPHGDTYTYWNGPRPAGPLRQVGGEWGWTDSDVPMGYGCAWSVVAGGGVVAAAQVPNPLAVEQGLESKPACPAKSATSISLQGAARAQMTVAGSWELLATDGKRLALARLDAQGRRTGELSLVGLDGRTLAAPQADATALKTAYRAWLAPEGLVLASGRKLTGPGWTIARADAATVGQGRVLYATGRSLRVRRIRGGADRPLVPLPAAASILLAAGSFGLAVATGDGSGKVALYRLPWRTIDRTLTG
jgi:hypothetical protein